MVAGGEGEDVKDDNYYADDDDGVDDNDDVGFTIVYVCLLKVLMNVSICLLLYV